jgi:hypothetical protein
LEQSAASTFLMMWIVCVLDVRILWVLVARTFGGAGKALMWSWLFLGFCWLFNVLRS